MMIDWSPAYAIGVPEVDEQHRELFARCARLVDALRAERGRGREEVTRTLLFLESYVAEHFAAEERLMARLGYPGLEGHRGLHQGFRVLLEKTRARLELEGATTAQARALADEARSWVLSHVLKCDREMGAWVQQARAAAAR